MNLTWLSGAAFAGGLAVLAGVLFALQRLRVRHREVEVVTTLFWREAIEETRARVLVQRFRHPWAYLLVLLVASLLWFAVAGPEFGGAGGREHVLVVDASAGMGWGTRFADALKAARERASELPRANTRVLLAGARVDTLLDRGEALPLFDRRIASRQPDECPASVQRALFDVASLASAEHPISIEVFGDAPVDKAALELLRKSVEVKRADLGAFDWKNNSGLVALGVTEAASGTWDRVDVYCEIARDGRGAELLGADPGIEWREIDATETRSRNIARDVPARGQRLDIRVTSGGVFMADDTATIVLPDRPLIRVALSPKTPEIVRTALAADPGVAIVDGEADVVVKHSGETFGGDAPAIELSDDASGPAFVVRRVAVVDAEDELRESFEELGLSEIDSTELAQTAGKPIELTLEVADRPGIALWSSLLDDRFDFAHGRAFPLFLARSVRWLARVEPIATTCAAGELASDGSQQWRDPNTKMGTVRDSVGAELRIPRAGEGENERGRIAHASLLDPGSSGFAIDDSGQSNALSASPATHGAGASELLPLIVLLAIALLLVEWWLVRTERIP